MNIILFLTFQLQYFHYYFTLELEMDTNAYALFAPSLLIIKKKHSALDRKFFATHKNLFLRVIVY